jgi:hypothetical protein
MGRREMHLRVWLGNSKDRDPLKDVCIVGGITLKCVWEKQDGKVWTGLVWLRIGTSSRLL